MIHQQIAWLINQRLVSEHALHLDELAPFWLFGFSRVKTNSSVSSKIKLHFLWLPHFLLHLMSKSSVPGAFLKHSL